MDAAIILALLAGCGMISYYGYRKFRSLLD